MTGSRGTGGHERWVGMRERGGNERNGQKGRVGIRDRWAQGTGGHERNGWT